MKKCNIYSKSGISDWIMSKLYPQLHHLPDEEESFSAALFEMLTSAFW